MSAGRRRRPWRIRRALREHRARTKCCSGSPRDRRAFRFGWPGSLSAGAACRAVQVPARRCICRDCAHGWSWSRGPLQRSSGAAFHSQGRHPVLLLCCLTARAGVAISSHDVHFASKLGGLKLENRCRSLSFSPSRLYCSPSMKERQRSGYVASSADHACLQIGAQSPRRVPYHSDAKGGNYHDTC
jgi:hypothetical protein